LIDVIRFIAGQPVLKPSFRRSRPEAEKKAEEEVKEQTYYLREGHSDKFSRTLTLPFPVDAGKASATLENGVLQIRLPKAEEAKSKPIEVKKSE
jgi:HSP20 family molecular chaperone IbpA